VDFECRVFQTRKRQLTIVRDTRGRRQTIEFVRSRRCRFRTGNDCEENRIIRVPDARLPSTGHPIDGCDLIVVIDLQFAAVRPGTAGNTETDDLRRRAATGKIDALPG
jgi:hypothetical protein